MGSLARGCFVGERVGRRLVALSALFDGVGWPGGIGIWDERGERERGVDSLGGPCAWLEGARERFAALGMASGLVVIVSGAMVACLAKAKPGLVQPGSHGLGIGVFVDSIDCSGGGGGIVPCDGLEAARAWLPGRGGAGKGWSCLPLAGAEMSFVWL